MFVPTCIIHTTLNINKINYLFFLGVVLFVGVIFLVVGSTIFLVSLNLVLESKDTHVVGALLILASLLFLDFLRIGDMLWVVDIIEYANLHEFVEELEFVDLLDFVEHLEFVDLLVFDEQL